MTEDERLKPYLRAGLTLPFATAIVNGVNPNEVLELWEQDWWKQYDESDYLIVATLTGKLTQEDAKWLNAVRSNHEILVQKCVSGDVKLEWARAIMGTGFSSDPDAVEMVLDGALPDVIARLRGIELDILPAELTPIPIPTGPNYVASCDISSSRDLRGRNCRYPIDEREFQAIWNDQYPRNECEYKGYEYDDWLSEIKPYFGKKGKVVGDDRSSDGSIKMRRTRASSDDEWMDAVCILVVEES
tara:strand:+ start:6693 stop:7424 length:732 start_codon:yes stop_codon:yes gene_type:complete